MTNAFPVVNWITLEGDFTDYRPAIGPDAQTVIFERTFSGHVTQLYILYNLQGSTSGRFMTNALIDLQQTRPDWNWDTDTIAFNVRHKDTNGVYIINIHTINADRTNLDEVPQTGSYIYPQWARLQDNNYGFVVMNTAGAEGPQSTLIDNSGNVVYADMNGTDANEINVFGGMPAVFPGQSTLIAFPGQPASNKWIGYNEDFNYIYLNGGTGATTFTSAPMEPSAPIDKFEDRFQGRAPVISPDGKYIAFESNRKIDGKNVYAIYLFDLSAPGNGAIRLTDPSEAGNAQHPKFFPDGKGLVFCATHPEKNQSRIAWIDISAYLSDASADQNS